MTANGDFVEGQVGWNGGNAHTIGTEPAPTFTPTASWNGAANVLVNSSNARKDIRGRPHQVVPGRRYKLYWRFRSTGASLFNAAVRLFNAARSEEHTSELQSLMRISYAVFCLKKKKQQTN